MAITVTISDPTRTVGIENIPRRGNQPSANNRPRSIVVTNAIAWKISERTIPRLIRIDSPDAPSRMARMIPSFRRRSGVP